MANYLILGASRGLGAALVEGLPRRGDTVFGLSRGEPDWLRRKSPVRRRWIEADLSELSAVQNARVVLGRAPIDALIHVAGIWDPEEFDDIHDDEIAEILDVDLRSFLAFARGLAPSLRRAGHAKIIAVGSTSGLENGDGSAVAYTAAKFGLRGACHALRQHFRKDGIAVTCLSPGSIASEIGYGKAADALKKHRTRRMPVEDVVALIRCVLDLSPAACVKEIAMPALKDEDV
ncbi:MAG TPA: SDR family oxidoreductase [Dongiaceae bacterium]|jgi:short-subunit dehydrogenase|nr:SDR family oxidoreductase [Dongiaceae bacterium]